MIDKIYIWDAFYSTKNPKLPKWGQMVQIPEIPAGKQLYLSRLSSFPESAVTLPLEDSGKSNLPEFFVEWEEPLIVITSNLNFLALY